MGTRRTGITNLPRCFVSDRGLSESFVLAVAQHIEVLHARKQKGARAFSCFRSARGYDSELTGTLFLRLLRCNRGDRFQRLEIKE